MKWMYEFYINFYFSYDNLYLFLLIQFKILFINLKNIFTHLFISLKKFKISKKFI
jgi:hypothetical protein